MEVRLAADTVAIVGESPLWIEREQAVYWIDGQRPHLMRLRPTTGNVETCSLPFRPSCVVPCSDGRLLIGYKKGLGVYDFPTRANMPLSVAGVDLRTVGFNDGACDRQGRLWIGTRHRDAISPRERFIG